jgi:ubiquitin carboxyl-terminal hydrolase 22/27/51
VSSWRQFTDYQTEHIKDLLSQAREKATGEYARLLRCIRDEDNLSGQIYKSGNTAVITNEATYLCIQCPAVSKTRERHRKDHPFCEYMGMILLHVLDTADSPQAVESKYGFIFCHDCADFVYDPTFEEIRSGNAKKRKRYTEEEERFIAANSTPVKCSTTGLRGLYNMGQTCFMSVILQSLVHNPFIREFFLGEGHKKEDCEREACTACALDDMINDFFGQEKHEGYGAVQMLQGCWKEGGSLAGYSQQDAHEFLGFLLNSLHTALTEDEEGGTMGARSAKHCQCDIHQIFCGLLKSTVTCSACKNTSTALDPFMDLSLDIRSTPVIKKKKLALTGVASTTKELAPMTLTECLDRFTSVETLSAEAGSYNCRHCSSPQEVKKKFSLSRLPPVIPIHLKRFEHERSAGTSSKVETRIRFPREIDLTPYTTSSSAKSKSKAESASPPAMTNGTADDKDGDDNEDTSAPKWTRPPRPVYELSSVVVHKGKIDNGHYISYSRQLEEWFRFDDSMVVQVDEREVFTAEAYMLFYVVAEI